MLSGPVTGSNVATSGMRTIERIGTLRRLQSIRLCAATSNELFLFSPPLFAPPCCFQVNSLERRRNARGSRLLEENITASGRAARSLNQHVWSLSRLPAACVCLPWRKLGPTVYTTSLPVRLSREAFEMSRDTDKSSSLWEGGGTFQERICPFFM